MSARRRLGFGRSRTSRRECLATGRLGLGSNPPLPLLLEGSGLSGTILLVAIGGRDVVNVVLTIRFGAVATAGRGGGLEERGGKQRMRYLEWMGLVESQNHN